MKQESPEQYMLWAKMLIVSEQCLKAAGFDDSKKITDRMWSVTYIILHTVARHIGESGNYQFQTKYLELIGRFRELVPDEQLGDFDIQVARAGIDEPSWRTK